MPGIAENLSRVEDAISAACRAAGRPRAEVQLVAVSKTHPVELLLEAAAAGQTVFGENRVQEFSAKHPLLHAAGYAVEQHANGSTETHAGPLQVHLIGHLQTNKAGRAAELFTTIDTLDSLRLAERLQESVRRLGRTLPVFLEIKLSDEESKEGLLPGSHELATLLERLPDLDHLVPLGLMTIAPFDGDKGVARSCFQRLRLMREEITRRHPKLSLPELSMGMSGDFATAIKEGSTQVRIGTAIFGARPRTA